MKSKLIIMAAAVASIASFTSSVQATPISGGISFAGAYTIPHGTDLTTPNNSITFGTTYVTSDTGSFSSIPVLPTVSLVTMSSPLAINPTVVPVLSLWSVGIYSFDSITLVESAQSATTLTLTGTGTIKDGNPADSVAGTWLATFNTLSDTFSYSASAGATVPDGGTTAMLLGGALAGLGLLKRKFLA
jgi:hypothetical protein